MANNRELSQFASFVQVNDGTNEISFSANANIGISTVKVQTIDKTAGISTIGVTTDFSVGNGTLYVNGVKAAAGVSTITSSGDGLIFTEISDSYVGLGTTVTKFIGINTSFPQAKLHINGGKQATNHSIGPVSSGRTDASTMQGSAESASMAVYYPKYTSALRVDGSAVIGISSDIGEFGRRAGSLTVSYDSPFPWIGTATDQVTGSEVLWPWDPGDTRRAMSLISRKPGAPVILCLRNTTTANAFFDFIAEPYSGALYLRSHNNSRIAMSVLGSSARVGFGTTTPVTCVHVHGRGGITYTDRPSAAVVTSIGVDANGLIRESTSSRRYKTDIQDYTKGLDEVTNLKPVTFKYNDDPSNSVVAGFIAEDLYEQGLSEFVLLDSDSEPKSVHYGNMISLLTNAIKELKQEIDALKSQIQQHNNN